MADTTTSATLAALLAWHRDMGCDDAVGEAPVDWLSRGDAAPGSTFRRTGAPGVPGPGGAEARPASAPQSPAARSAPSRPAPQQVSAAPAAPRQFPSAVPDDAPTAARTAARAAGSLEALRATL